MENGKVQQQQINKEYKEEQTWGNGGKKNAE